MEIWKFVREKFSKKRKEETRVQGFVKKGKINWKDERKLSNL